MDLIERIARAIAVADLVPETMMTRSELEFQGYIGMAEAAKRVMEEAGCLKEKVSD